jgi:hypothetical protein
MIRALVIICGSLLYALIVVGLLLCVVGEEVFAMESRTYEDIRAACSGDAYKLCSWHDLRAARDGHYDQVAACMRNYHSQLSKPCRETLTKYGYL